MNPTKNTVDVNARDIRTPALDALELTLNSFLDIGRSGTTRLILQYAPIDSLLNAYATGDGRHYARARSKDGQQGHSHDETIVLTGLPRALGIIAPYFTGMPGSLAFSDDLVKQEELLKVLGVALKMPEEQDAKLTLHLRRNAASPAAATVANFSLKGLSWAEPRYSLSFEHDGASIAAPFDSKGVKNLTMTTPHGSFVYLRNTHDHL